MGCDAAQVNRRCRIMGQESHWRAALSVAGSFGANWGADYAHEAAELELLKILSDRSPHERRKEMREDHGKNEVN